MTQPCRLCKKLTAVAKAYTQAGRFLRRFPSDSQVEREMFNAISSNFYYGSHKYLRKTEICKCKEKP